MIRMLEAVFWVAVFGSLYSYFIYPLVLMALPAKRALPAPASGSVTMDTQAVSPSVSLIVTAHNDRA
jgi:K+-transporting ATPase c subunit